MAAPFFFVELHLNYVKVMCNPPQQGDSNLGWVGGHQWGLSWRDRPPTRHPQASPPSVSVQHRNCLCATQKLSLFNREHIVFVQKLTKNQKWAEMGRRATVLSIRGGENDPTGLPEPLGLFVDPKNGQTNLFCPPGPPAGESP